MNPVFRPGDVIDGKYEVVTLLGAGGMGHVFKVRHLQLDAFRTIKQLRNDLLADEAYRGRFVREARLATRVQHPNVALVHDFATLADGSSYIVSEFIEGVTLRQWMQAHGRFSLELALQIAKQALAGIETIHRAGLVHRDISPDNLMIATGVDGRLLVKIIDLGIAKAADAPSMDATQAGTYVGNPRYSSPEQLGALRDGETIDGRVDLYCFGGVLFEMLAGQAPFTSNSPQGYAMQHLTAKPPSLRTFDGSIPEGVDAAVQKALEKNREHRYRTAREMSAELARFATGVLTQTSQMKLGALTDGDPSLTPPPAPPPEQDMFARIDALVQRGDISALSRLAEMHAPETKLGSAVRAALDRMADETLHEVIEDPEAERRRREREAFHAAIDALRNGDPRPAEELAARTTATHIRQRLKTGLAEHYAKAAAASAVADPEQRPRSRDEVALLAETRDYQRAMQTGTELAMRVYLATWPHGAHRKDVSAALTRLQNGEAAARPRPAAPPPRTNAPRAIPLTAQEMLPGTMAAPLPPAETPSAPPRSPLSQVHPMVWVAAIATLAVLAVVTAAVLWWSAS
ncbi:MAG TPA: serine/threonine-protein kinase [Thermoanaerobaculia bacterium]|nr:serine/threonine-protein kinase [Thermoanaerobaculia bacterium]